MTFQITSSRSTIETDDISTLGVSVLRILKLVWRDVEASVHKTLVTPRSLQQAHDSFDETNRFRLTPDSAAFIASAR